jgi:hypothetical protein
MPIVGYIVQYSNEDDYTIYHGFMRLYKQFSDALEHAQELMRGFMLTQGEGIQIFRSAKPTKKECDDQGSVVVFESRDYIVWIDAVICEN